MKNLMSLSLVEDFFKQACADDVYLSDIIRACQEDCREIFDRKGQSTFGEMAFENFEKIACGDDLKRLCFP